VADKHSFDHWVTGTSQCLRRLIADGADNEELQRFLDAKRAGDCEVIEQVINRKRTTPKASWSTGSEDEILQLVRVAAIKPVVNSLDVPTLYRFIQLALQLSRTVVSAAKEEEGPIFSSAETTESLARIVFEVSMEHLRAGTEERYQQILLEAVRMFGPDAAAEYMVTRNFALGGQTPAELARTNEGARQVLNELIAQDRGGPL